MNATIVFRYVESLVDPIIVLRREYHPAEQTDFEIHAFDRNARTLDHFKRLRDLGVTDICTFLWNSYVHETDQKSILGRIERFGDEIISYFEEPAGAAG